MKPRIKRDLTLRDYIEMERMELDCYGAEHTTPAAEAMRWAERIPSGILAAADARGIAGFVNLFPVDGRVHALLRVGQCYDRDLSAEELPAAPFGDAAALFLRCILGREDLGGTGLAYALTETAMRQYDALSVHTLITDNATPAGCAFSARICLHPVCKTDYGTVVHEGDYRTAREAVRHLSAQFGELV